MQLYFVYSFREVFAQRPIPRNAMYIMLCNFSGSNKSSEIRLPENFSLTCFK